jgi:hypothetical protein
MLDRQKIVGWMLVVVGAAYLVYFWKVRLFEPGPALTRKEWFEFIGSIVLLIIGTANVRLAAMRERKRRGLSN